MVADPHLGSWLAHWVIEMNWEAFTALGLDRNNMVEVYHLGDAAPPPVPDVPPAPPEETPPADETPIDPGDTGDETPVVEETPTAPAEPSETPTVTPTAPAETPTPEPTPTNPPATPTPEPTEPADDTVESPFAGSWTIDPAANYTLAYSLERSNIPGKANASVSLGVERYAIDNYHLAGSEFGTAVEQWLADGVVYRLQPDGTIQPVGDAAAGDPAAWMTWLPSLNGVPRATPVGDGHYRVGARAFLSGLPGVDSSQISSASGTVDVWMSDSGLITYIAGTISTTNTDGTTGSLSISLSVSAVNATTPIPAP
jgi:hypothetical protein